MLASKSNKPGSFYIIYNSSYGHQFKTGKFLLVWPAVFCLASRPGVETFSFVFRIFLKNIITTITFLFASFSFTIHK